jgi:hypothetical protein
MTRKEANLQILAKLTQYAMLNDDQRFGQILRNVGVIIDFQEPGSNDFTPRWTNHFNEESTQMLNRVEKTLKKGSLT